MHLTATNVKDLRENSPPLGSGQPGPVTLRVVR
jgi:hypothetical protein